MQLKTAQAGLAMSPVLIKQEMSDLKEIVMIYDTNTVETQISTRSSVQQRLWDLFNLDTAKDHLTRHQPIR